MYTTHSRTPQSPQIHHPPGVHSLIAHLADGPVLPIAKKGSSYAPRLHDCPIRPTFAFASQSHAASKQPCARSPLPQPKPVGSAAAEPYLPGNGFQTQPHPTPDRNGLRAGEFVDEEEHDHDEERKIQHKSAVFGACQVLQPLHGAAKDAARPVKAVAMEPGVSSGDRENSDRHAFV